MIEMIILVNMFGPLTFQSHTILNKDNQKADERENINFTQSTTRYTIYKHTFCEKLSDNIKVLSINDICLLQCILLQGVCFTACLIGNLSS